MCLFVKCECLNQLEYAGSGEFFFCQYGLECFWSLVYCQYLPVPITVSDPHTQIIPAYCVHFTWLQPLRHSSSNLMPTVSLPVYLSTSSCLNFPPVSSLSPVTLHTPSPSLCRVPSPDMHETSWHEISSNSSSVMWCVISIIHFNEIKWLFFLLIIIKDMID